MQEISHGESNGYTYTVIAPKLTKESHPVEWAALREIFQRWIREEEAAREAA